MLVFSSVDDMRLILRILVAVSAFFVAFVIVHVVIFLIVAFIIPRLEPNSYWSRELNSYMASVFPRKWGKPPG